MLDKNGRAIEAGDYVVAPVWYRTGRNDILKVIGVGELDGESNPNVTGVAQGIPATVHAKSADCTIVLKGDGSLPS